VAAGPDAGRLRVVGAAHWAMSPSSESALSPDGRWLVYAADGKRVCLRPVDGGADRCSAAGAAPVPQRYRWSPDGTEVVFTDNWLRHALDPDLYLVRVPSMSVAALTPDDRTSLVDGRGTGEVDVFGQVGRDGRVRFLRADGTGDTTPARPCSIAMTGGAVDCAAALPIGLGQMVDAEWSHDGSRLAYLRYPPDTGTSSVHVVGSDGHEQWSRSTDAGQPWTKLAFSADDGYLLLGAAIGETGPAAAAVLPSGGGDPVPVSRGPAASFPAWSPTGAALVYGAAPPGSGSQPPALWVVGAPGGTARRLDTRSLAPLSTDDVGLTWRADRLAGRDTRTGDVVVLHLTG
jgi:Tol biopolymer transport system component